MDTLDTKLLPDFLIIGAGKSGTTSLDNYLKQHPEIFITPVKEPNFFAYDGLDESSFELENTRQHFRESVTTASAYQALFQDAKPGQRKGETSNLYMYSEHGYKNIKRYVPNTKLIAILRQPAERLYSRYLHLAREDRLPTENFDALFERGNIWWKQPDLINEGFYFKHLSPFFENFPHENIKIFLYEDLKNNPQKLLEDIYRFVGVATGFSPDTDVQLNQSGYIKSKTMNKVIGADNVFFKSAKAIAPGLFQKAKNSNQLQKILSKIRSRNLDRPGLSIEMKRKVTNEIYKEDILGLEKMIKRPLDHWLEF